MITKEMSKDIEHFAMKHFSIPHVWIGLPREQIDNMTRKDFEGLKDNIAERLKDYERKLQAQIVADLRNLFRAYDIKIPAYEDDC